MGEGKGEEEWKGRRGEGEGGGEEVEGRDESLRLLN